MKNRAKIVCLSNVYDEHYRDLRNEAIPSSLSSPKRRDFLHCLEAATGREVVVLSAPPKALDRKTSRWLPAVETRFSTHRQLFCANWDTSIFRIPLSWVFYAAHVLRNVRDGDIVVIDNFEILYVIAARLFRLFRKVSFLLEYEDGKHLIDKGWDRLLSGLAEAVGKPLLHAAVLTHPALGARLPKSLPTELVPGFIVPSGFVRHGGGGPIRFLYTGSLDSPRGVEMLLAALPYLPEEGWRLDITGDGPLADQVRQVADDPKWGGKVSFHGILPRETFQKVVAEAHVGLNCQLSADPISSVTFPSKIFSYLSAGLVVLSSRASEVPAICGQACLYFDEETPASLAEKMGAVIQDLEGVRSCLDLTSAAARFSTEGTAVRLKRLIELVLQRR